MEFSIRYDPDAFAGGADMVTGAVREGMDAIAARLAGALDEVFASHAGRPVAEVAARLREAAAARGFDLAEEDVAVCADTISAGRRMSVDVGWR